MGEKAVFVVTEGTYSNYHILAVFSTRKAARTYLTEYDKRDVNDLNPPKDDGGEPDPRIERYVLDPGHPKKWARGGAYEVSIFANGEAGLWSYRDGISPHEAAKVTWHRTYGGDFKPRPRYVGYGKTKEHARRSAEELRRAHQTGQFISEPPSNQEASA
jgi:hypothetical protein